MHYTTGKFHHYLGKKRCYRCYWKQEQYFSFISDVWYNIKLILIPITTILIIYQLSLLFQDVSFFLRLILYWLFGQSVICAALTVRSPSVVRRAFFLSYSASVGCLSFLWCSQSHVYQCWRFLMGSSLMMLPHCTWSMHINLHPPLGYCKLDWVSWCELRKIKTMHIHDCV